MQLYKRFKKGLETSSDKELESVLSDRATQGNRYPMEVFNSALSPFLNDMIDKFDIPPCFVGTNLIHAYSTAIGSAYAVSTNGESKDYMTVWCCLNGRSSSGKSLSYDIIHAPIFKMQRDLEAKWDYETQGLDGMEIKDKHIKMIMFRDIQVATLLRSILPDNPKGMCKYVDEIMEWFNTMNPGRSGKEGSEEQFWLSAWSCKPYSGVRAGKQVFAVPRPYIPVCGGIQPKILYKMFMNDRDITGFVFRILFATPNVHRIAMGDRSYRIPKEYTDIHHKAIISLYKDLPVKNSYEDPKLCIMDKEANAEYEAWRNQRALAINALADMDDGEIQSGILGKLSDYAIRFAGILRMMDKAIEVTSTGNDAKYYKEEKIDREVMKRALKLLDYYFQTAVDAYNLVAKKVTAPDEVMTFANMRKANKTFQEIAAEVWGDKENTKSGGNKARIKYQEYLKQYPKVFGAKNI